MLPGRRNFYQITTSMVYFIRMVDRTKVAEGGRIVIPAAYRKALGIKTGDEVLLKLDGDSLRIYSRAQAVRLAQKIVRKYVPEGVSLVDELLQERRQEAANE